MALEADQVAIVRCRGRVLDGLLGRTKKPYPARLKFYRAARAIHRTRLRWSWTWNVRRPPRHANLPEQRGNVGIQGDRHHVDRRIIQRSRAAEAGAPVPIARPSAPVGTLRSLEVTISSMNPKPRHIERALRERVEIVPYDPAWPGLFAEEVARLRAALPAELIGRIEHFGSTAVPGLAAKPIIDMLVEVRSMEDVAERIAPLLRALGYEFFWRAPGTKLPGMGTRGSSAAMLRAGARIPFILSAGSSEWGRLRFRDYLRAHSEVARAYGALKQRIAAQYPDDRIAYAKAKTCFVREVMRAVRRDHIPW
ncbi:MAG: GrpB family protein [Thauera sp.]|nr:GrpB family protein [Thauera sp.]